MILKFSKKKKKKQYLTCMDAFMSPQVRTIPKNAGIIRVVFVKFKKYFK